MELRQPPISVKATGVGGPNDPNPLSGILGTMLGESSETQKARLEEASSRANDVTNLVKRKKQLDGPTGAEVHGPAGKRKMGTEGTKDLHNDKKAKVEDAFPG